MRVSFAGELGWEIHSRTEDTPAVWDIVMRAGKGHGLRPFGMFALNSLRVEKGYRAWKGDLSTDYTILQGGLERFVDWTKDDFRGKAALAAEKQAGVTKRFVALTAEVGECDPPYMSTLWQNGTVVGETTSAYWGHRVGACVALGMLRADLAEPGTAAGDRGLRHPLPGRGAGRWRDLGPEERKDQGVTPFAPFSVHKYPTGVRGCETPARGR